MVSRPLINTVDVDLDGLRSRECNHNSVGIIRRSKYRIVIFNVLLESNDNVFSQITRLVRRNTAGDQHRTAGSLRDIITVTYHVERVAQ